MKMVSKKCFLKQLTPRMLKQFCFTGKKKWSEQDKNTLEHRPKVALKVEKYLRLSHNQNGWPKLKVISNKINVLIIKPLSTDHLYAFFVVYWFFQNQFFEYMYIFQDAIRVSFTINIQFKPEILKKFYKYQQMTK